VPAGLTLNKSEIYPRSVVTCLVKFSEQSFLISFLLSPSQILLHTGISVAWFSTWICGHNRVDSIVSNPCLGPLKSWVLAFLPDTFPHLFSCVVSWRCCQYLRLSIVEFQDVFPVLRCS
jgi:hypothetical protein